MRYLLQQQECLLNWPDRVPVTWKDVFDIAGIATTCGSLISDRTLATKDAAAVARLHALGAVSVGKTNMSEFAFSGLGLNPHFGTPVNPYSPLGRPHVCGGSSSGAAAAVAHRLCAIICITDECLAARFAH